MSSNLDKLKALTIRLERRLKQQEKASFIVQKTPKTIVISEEEHTDYIPLDIPQDSHIIKRTAINCDNIRDENIDRVHALYVKLKIYDKSPLFENIFLYKAMNLSGIGLKEDDFGEVREGKYIQIIAITYEPDKNGKKKAKNISLGYFGKAETLDVVLKNEIIEFVLRWRYEKAFQNVEHYKDLIEKVDLPIDNY
jgi:hypothetical protein